MASLQLPKNQQCPFSRNSVGLCRPPPIQLWTRQLMPFKGASSIRGASVSCSGAHEAANPTLGFVSPPHPAMQRSLDASPSTSATARQYLQQKLSLSVQPEVDLSGLSVAHDLEPTISLLLRIQSQQRVAALLRAHPELLGVQLEDWRDFLAEYGVSSHFFFKLLGSHPRLFIQGSLFIAGQSIMLLQALGLTTRDISAHIIPRAPEVLYQPGLITAVAHFLTAPPAGQYGAVPGTVNLISTSTAHTAPEESAPDLGGLGLTREELRSLLSRCPRVLLMPVDQELRPRLDYLRNTLGFAGEEVRHLVCINSSLLLVPVAPQLEAHLGFLTHTVGCSSLQAQALLLQCADLLALSIGNLERKWSFLTNVIFGHATDAATAAFKHLRQSQSATPQAGQADRMSDAVSQTPVSVILYPPDSSSTNSLVPLSGSSAGSGPDALPEDGPSSQTAGHSPQGYGMSSTSGIMSEQPGPRQGTRTEGQLLTGGDSNGTQGRILPSVTSRQEPFNLISGTSKPNQAGSGLSSQGGELAQGDVQEGRDSAMHRARAAVLAFPGFWGTSLLNDIGPRFRYACDRGLLHHLLEYEEQTGRVSLSLRLLLDCNSVQYVSRVQGDEDDYETYCAHWRRTQAGSVALSAINPAEASW